MSTENPAQNPDGLSAWPSSSAQLRDASRTPDTFEPIGDVHSTPTGLDLTHPLAPKLLDVSKRAADLLDERVDIMQTMRADAAAARAAAADAAAERAAAERAAAAAFPVSRQVAPARRPRRSGVQILLLVGGIVLLASAAIFFLFVAYAQLTDDARVILLAAAGVGLLAFSWLLHARALTATSTGLTWLGLTLLVFVVGFAGARDVFVGPEVNRLLVVGVGLLIVNALALAHVRLSGSRAGAQFAAVGNPISTTVTVWGVLRTIDLANRGRVGIDDFAMLWVGLAAGALTMLTYRWYRGRMERLLVRVTSTIVLVSLSLASLIELLWVDSTLGLWFHLASAAVWAVMLVDALLQNRRSDVSGLFATFITIGLALTLATAPMATARESFPQLNMWLWPLAAAAIAVGFGGIRLAARRIGGGAAQVAMAAHVTSAVTMWLAALLAVPSAVNGIVRVFSGAWPQWPSSVVVDEQPSAFAWLGPVPANAISATVTIVGLAVALFILSRLGWPRARAGAQALGVFGLFVLATLPTTAFARTLAFAAVAVVLLGCAIVGSRMLNTRLAPLLAPLAAGAPIAIVVLWLSTFSGVEIWAASTILSLACIVAYRVLVVRAARAVPLAVTSGVGLVMALLSVNHAHLWLRQVGVTWPASDVVIAVIQCVLALGVLVVVLVPTPMVTQRPEAVVLGSTALVGLLLGVWQLAAAENGSGVWWSLLVLVAAAAVRPTQALLDSEPRWRQTAASSVAAAAAAVAWVVTVFAEQIDPVDLISVILSAGLLTAGTIDLLRHEDARSWPALAPGLMTLLVPSLLLTWGSSDLWRVIALGIVALVVFVAGFAAKLKAPLVIGASVLLTHVIVQTSPYIAASYRSAWWVWLAVGGIILVLLAAFSERNIRTMRSAVRQIAQLR